MNKNKNTLHLIMENKRLSHLFIQLTSLGLVLIFATLSYGWFAVADYVGGMSYSIAKIDSSVTIYTANDDNLNGVPNLLPTPISAAYYEERFSFTKHGDEVYALSEDTELNTLEYLTFDNVFPTAVYTVKYEIINRSSVENRMSFKFAADELNDETLLAMTAMSVRLGAVRAGTDGGDATVEFGEKIYLADCISGTAFLETTLTGGENNVFIGGYSGPTNKSNCLDLWLQFELETYSDLVAHDPDIALTEDEYDMIRGASVELPTLYIYFEIVYER